MDEILLNTRNLRSGILKNQDIVAIFGRNEKKIMHKIDIKRRERYHILNHNAYFWDFNDVNSSLNKEDLVE
jgi:hypothetical protein